MGSLEELHLFENQLASLPKSIRLLTKLKILDLECNQIASVAGDLLDGLRNIEELKVGFTAGLQKSVVEMTRLRILKISNVETFNLDIFNSIEDLADLRYLAINGCPFYEFPDRISRLGNLLELNPIGNRSKIVPTIIGRPINLEKLSLRYDRLSEIPSEVGSLWNLVGLNLSNNRL